MKKLSVSLLILLAILSVAVAVVYLTKTAGALPHFFLGYSRGSTHKHTKHALAFIGLAVVLGLGAWMVSGSSSSSSPSSPVKKPDQE